MKKISVLLFFILISSFSIAQENNSFLCSDGIDNDGDGQIDCQDNECAQLPNNGCSTCFNDGYSFADKVISYNNPCPNSLNTDPQAAIGVSDFSTVPSNEFVTLGNGGFIILEFVNNVLINSGSDSTDLADVWIFEVGPAVEASFIALRPVKDSITEAILIDNDIPDNDLDGFYEFGTISGSTSYLDIDEFLNDNHPSGTLKFNAIKITDVPSSRCDGNYPGADIDAVCALSNITCVLSKTVLEVVICPGQTYEGYNAPGTYTDTLIASTGCDSIRVLELIENNLELTDIQTVIATCGRNNGRIIIDAKNGIEPLAYSVDSINFQSSNTFDDLSPGTYTIIVRDGNGCTKTADATIGFTPDAEAAISGVLDICEGDSTNLTASGGSSYQWNTGDTVEVLTVRSQGMYTVTVTDFNECQDQETVMVTVNDLPIVELGVEKDTLCIDEELIDLIGMPAGGSFSGIGVLGNQFDPSVAGVGKHTVVYTYEDLSGCMNIDSMELVVIDGECIVGLKSINTADLIKISPNPSTGIFSVVAENWRDKINVNIFNIQGQLVFSSKSNRNKFTIEVEAKGIYFIELSNDKQVVSKKINYPIKNN